MDNLFEYIKQQLLCEKEIIQNVYDLLQLLNSEFARELLDKQQGDFIITYYFSRQSRIKKFNKVSDDLINFIYKYRNYNYMMQNQFDKIMQAITMSKTLQNDKEQSYQITDILDIGTMFKLLELDWIKRHNMTKVLCQPQTTKKIEKLNQKEINKISLNQNSLFPEKDSSLQLYSNLNDLTNSKNKNQIISNISKDQNKSQKDDFIIQIESQNQFNSEEEKVSKQNNLDFSREEIDQIIFKNQQKCLEFFKSFKQTWNFDDLKKNYFDEIQEKCIFHHTLSEEQIKVLNKYEQSITKCRNKLYSSSKIKSRKFQSYNQENQDDKSQQDDKLDNNQQIINEMQDNNSYSQKNVSDQKTKKQRGGFRKKRNKVGLNQCQQDIYLNLNNCENQIQIQSQKQQENSQNVKDLNEQFNKVICTEQVETNDSNEVSQQCQLNSEKMHIEQSCIQNHDYNIQIQTDDQQQERIVESANKIKEEQVEQEQNNLSNYNSDNSSKIKQIKVEENNFQLQSPQQSLFQDKLNSFLAYQFLNSPFPLQFNGKVEQFELEQLNNENVQQNNTDIEQQKTKLINQVQNEYDNGIMDEEKAKKSLQSTLFENIQLNFENKNFGIALKNLNDEPNFNDQYEKQEFLLNKVTKVDCSQNFSDQHFQISQELFKFKEENSHINEAPILLNDANNQNQIPSKVDDKQEYLEMQNNLQVKKEYQYQDLIIEEEENQILEKLIQTDKLSKSHSKTFEKSSCKEKEISEISNLAENASSFKDSPIKLRMVDIFELKCQSDNNSSNQKTSTQKQSELMLQQEKSQKVKSPNKIQKINKEKRKKKVGKTFKELTYQELEIVKKSSIKEASNLAKQLGMSYQTMRKVINKVQNGDSK